MPIGNNNKYDLIHFPSPSKIHIMNTHLPAYNCVNLYVGLKYICNDESEHLCYIGLFDSNLKEVLFGINIEPLLETKTLLKCQLKSELYYNVITTEDYSNKDLTIYFNKRVDTNENLLYYKGETRKGYKSGHGKEFYQNSVLKYEGEFREDIFNGDGTLYDDNLSVIYTGRFIDGAPDFN